MGGTSEQVNVRSGGTTTVRLGPASSTCRIDATVFFDTARSFIYPVARTAFEQAFAFGLTESAAEPTPTPDRFLLSVGHTDQTGSRSLNEALSVRRARAARAVFTVEPDVWETLYQTEGWGSGVVEIETMSTEVDGGATVNQYRTDPVARRDLFERYLRSLRPAWVPATIPPLHPAFVTAPPDATLGCDFQHPRRDAPGQAVDENRRTEFVFFPTADPGVEDCTNYGRWLSACGSFITVEIELIDECGDPYVGPFDLTMPTGSVLADEQTDARGNWSRANMPTGRYTVTIDDTSLVLEV